ncbi:MAG: EscU/YscU/HrcU family type III secretion system export apparatus switch protein [Deltaproteobacteria bacterium]|nr:EscU/YscU/HrcU family type III secretion system export apparatus switch protein [Deltaproteobacteria bacterium]
MAEDKGHKPSKRRLEKARREGRVPKSPILTQSISILAGLGGLFIVAPYTWVTNRMLLEYCWSDGLLEPRKCAVTMGNLLLETVLPSLLFAALVSILVEGLQVGFRFDAGLLAARASNFQLANGVKRLVSGLRNSWQSLLRLIVLSFVFAWFFSDIVKVAGGWIAAPWNGQAADAGRFFRQLLSRAGLLVVFFGIVEYAVRRRLFMKEVSMSIADLRQEHKEDEGDPHIRAARHALRRTMTYGELVARTRKSKVIVVEKASLSAAHGISK